MAWICVRKATDEDYQALNKVAASFCNRHPEVKIAMNITEELAVISGAWFFAVEGAIRGLSNYGPDVAWGAYLNKLWTQCFRRAVGHKLATSIAYGSIGYHQD